MKKTIFILLAFATFSCKKEKTEPERNLQSELTFQSVTRLAPGPAGELRAATTVVGANLCYNFTRFEVSDIKPNQFDIYARGTVPQTGQVCAQAVYRKDTIASIAKPAPGVYILNYWNPHNQIFKKDTITVN